MQAYNFSCNPPSNAVERSGSSSKVETHAAAVTRSGGAGCDWQGYLNSGTQRPSWDDFNEYDSDPYVTASMGGGQTERRACPFCGSTPDIDKHSKTMLWFTNSGHWQCVACDERRRPFAGVSDDDDMILQLADRYVSQNRTRMHAADRKVWRALTKHMRAFGSITDMSAGSHMLAEQTGIPQRAVDRMLKKFVRCGLLQQTYTGKQGAGVDCAARFTLLADGMSTPFTDPMAKHYERQDPFNGSVHTFTKEPRSVDTQSRFPTDARSDDSPLAEQESWQADGVEGDSAAPDPFGRHLLGWGTDADRTSMPARQADERRALRFNRLKLFGGEIPDDLADLQTAYEAKRARRLAIRAAIDADEQQPIVPQEAVRAVAVADPTATTPGALEHHVAVKHRETFSDCGWCAEDRR